MRKRIFKLYTNYEKEEVWLNQMAASGWNCISYCFGRYEFEKGTPGEYTYRIQLLDYAPTHPNSAEYLALLEDAGIELFASHIRWVYLRKKTSGGSFELFSDRGSRITHYKRIIAMLLPLALVNFVFGVGLLENGRIIRSFNLAAALILAVPIFSYYRRMNDLEKDSQILE